METNIGKNIFFASSSTIILAVLTLVFWLLAARIAGAEAMGTTNAIVSISTIIVTIDVVNTHLGIKRYLGIAISLGNLGKFKQILVSTLGFVSITVSISAILLVLPSMQIIELTGISRQYAWIIVAIIPALAFNNILPEVLIASHKSKNLATTLLISSLARFPIILAAIYLLNAQPTFATIVAYSSSLFITPILCLVHLRNIIRHPQSVLKDFGSNLRPVLGAGVASWIPTIISVVGSQLGIITVFTVEGGAEAGKFYLPLTIFTIALFVVSGINRVSHPLIAGMNTEQEKTNFFSYWMKIAFIFTMPVAVPLLYFSSDFLGLVGPEFANAGATLSILMVGLPLSIVCEMVYYYVYGRGDMRAVLFLGLAGNIPRIVLYLVFVPFLGAKGAALGYLIGSLVQLIYSVMIAKSYSLNTPYRKYVLITSVPLVIGAVMWVADLNFVISTVVILAGSSVFYIRSHLLTESELRNVIYASLPVNIANKIYPPLSAVMHRFSKK